MSLARTAEMAIGQFYRDLAHVNRFRSALKNPKETQLARLIKIVRANESSVFGRKHNFDKIHSLTDWQRYVPSNRYEDLEPYIEKLLLGQNGQLTVEPVVMFATTSGTTGKPKYVPITESHVKDYAHAFQIHNYHLVRDIPKAAQGRFLIFASNDEEGVSEGGISFGAVSGLLRRRQSPLVQKYFALPQSIGKIKDVDSKYYAMLRLSLCQDVSAILGCNPSTFLLFADQMKEHAQALIADIFDGSLRKQYAPSASVQEAIRPLLKADRKKALELEAILASKGQLIPKDVWPNLNVLSCWKGGPLAFYLDRLPEYYGQAPVRDFGYMASEGRGTIPIHNEGAGGVLALSCHFFEFVLEDEIDRDDKRFFTADQLEVGGRYFIHFTTSAGLYRYNIHDIIEVVGYEQMCPVIQFVQKGVGVSSVTGEKLTEEQVQIALRYAVRQTGLTNLDHFTFAVEMGYPPHYVCFVELRSSMSDSVMDEFLRTFEQSLQLQNIEYKEKRMSRRLGAPTLQVIPSGTFTKLRQQRVAQGAPEAQVKIPLLDASPAFRENIANLANISLNRS